MSNAGARVARWVRFVTRRSTPGAFLLGTVAITLAAPPASAVWGPCSRTALAGLLACRNDVRDDFYEAIAVCLNEPEPADLAECRDEAREERTEGRQECRDVFVARRDLCAKLGEAAYDPDFEPEDFDSDFSNPTTPNPYWPLGIGNMWKYEGGDETIHVQVLDETKRIEGVTCIVVNDTAEEDGNVNEKTDDWQALAKDGTVHYCGEISQEFESFPGDVPQMPELLGTEGSWKAGRDGAKPGILMQSPPMVGQTYRQEWAFGGAEDHGEVLSTTYGYGNDEELDDGVPEDLAELLCDDDCVVIRDLTALEPDASERKYFASGIGLFLEVDEVEGDVVQLVECNVDPLCDVLPEPAEEEE